MKEGDIVYICVIREKWVYTTKNGYADDSLCRDAIRRLTKGEKISLLFAKAKFLYFSAYGVVVELMEILAPSNSCHKIGCTYGFHSDWIKLGSYANKILTGRKERVVFT